MVGVLVAVVVFVVVLILVLRTFNFGGEEVWFFVQVVCSVGWLVGMLMVVLVVFVLV